MDATDKRILAVLQRDGDCSVADIAEQVGITQTPCWKRIKRLRDSGVFLKRVGLVDSKKIGLELTGFVHIRATHNSSDWLIRFAEELQKIPEIVECHRMTGDIDYLLKVVAPSMEGYDRIYKKLVDIGGLVDISVSFSMERMKTTTVLPLDYA